MKPGIYTLKEDHKYFWYYSKKYNIIDFYFNKLPGSIDKLPLTVVSYDKEKELVTLLFDKIICTLCNENSLYKRTLHYFENDWELVEI